MSHTIATFIAKVENSPELQQKLETIEENLTKQRAESLASLSQEAGTPISAAEFLAAATSASRELDEAALEGVSGGAFPNLRDIRPGADIVMRWLGLK